MHKEHPEPLSDFVVALPGLLRGRLAQALEIALAVKADRTGPLACEFAMQLLQEELAVDNHYGVLERWRVEELDQRLIKIISAGRGLAGYKLEIAHHIACAVTKGEPLSFRFHLCCAVAHISSMRNSCIRKIKRLEARHAA